MEKCCSGKEAESEDSRDANARYAGKEDADASWRQARRQEELMVVKSILGTELHVDDQYIEKYAGRLRDLAPDGEVRCEIVPHTVRFYSNVVGPAGPIWISSRACFSVPECLRPAVQRAFKAQSAKVRCYLENVGFKELRLVCCKGMWWVYDPHDEKSKSVKSSKDKLECLAWLRVHGFKYVDGKDDCSRWARKHSRMAGYPTLQTTAVAGQV